MRPDKLPTPQESPRESSDAPPVDMEEAMHAAARTIARSEVKYLRSDTVSVPISARGSWDGKVAVFEVVKHPPKYVYVFPKCGKPGSDYAAVLGIYPVESALDAVDFWLKSEAKRRSA